MKNKAKLEKENNNAAYKKANKEAMGQMNCIICPPFEGENGRRKPKHGPKKPKYKDKK